MTNLQARKIEELKSGFTGEIIIPSDGAYENARKIWNAMNLFRMNQNIEPA